MNLESSRGFAYFMCSSRRAARFADASGLSGTQTTYSLRANLVGIVDASEDIVLVREAKELNDGMYDVEVHDFI